MRGCCKEAGEEKGCEVPFTDGALGNVEGMQGMSVGLPRPAKASSGTGETPREVRVVPSPFRSKEALSLTRPPSL